MKAKATIGPDSNDSAEPRSDNQNVLVWEDPIPDEFADITRCRVGGKLVGYFIGDTTFADAYIEKPSDDPAHPMQGECIAEGVFPSQAKAILRAAIDFAA